MYIVSLWASLRLYYFSVHAPFPLILIFSSLTSFLYFALSSLEDSYLWCRLPESHSDCDIFRTVHHSSSFVQPFVPLELFFCHVLAYKVTHLPSALQYFTIFPLLLLLLLPISSWAHIEIFPVYVCWSYLAYVIRLVLLRFDFCLFRSRW